MIVQYQPQMISARMAASHSKVGARGITTHDSSILQNCHVLLFISIEKKLQPLCSRPEIVNLPCILSWTPFGAVILVFPTGQHLSSNRCSQGYLQTISGNKSWCLLLALATKTGMNGRGLYLRVDRAKARKT
jgi:hypothetical protein